MSESSRAREASGAGRFVAGCLGKAYFTSSSTLLANSYPTTAIIWPQLSARNCLKNWPAPRSSQRAAPSLETRHEDEENGQDTNSDGDEPGV